MATRDIPDLQRALVLQGGGALGAYDAGVFQAIYEEFDGKNENERLFDIVAGTSSGAMNAAILVSHVIENNNSWKDSADKLNGFWDYVSRDQGGRKIGMVTGEGIPDFSNWWEYWHSANSSIASEEAARRYYSAKQFLYTGVPRVFFPLLPRPDDRFFDNFSVPNNMWYMYSNQPLKDSLQKFAKFPIATSSDLKQPRLLLVSVDVLEGAAVTFDSYPKADDNRKTEYGENIKLVDVDDNNNDSKRQYEYTIPYNDGIKLDYAIASGSVPINYDYAKIEANKLTIDNQGNKIIEKIQRYFWDGGIASNTPLRELIQSHKDYWLGVIGKGKEEKDVPIPDLDIYIVDVWPTKEKNIPIDHDGVMDRNYDLLLNDKTDYDEKVANIVSDYVKLVKDLIGLAKSKNISRTEIDGILSQPAKSSHRTGQRRTYNDLIQGRFDVNIKRIERISDIDNDISNKLFDYSADTINQLIRDGYHDALKKI
jgi:NTE family protein